MQTTREILDAYQCAPTAERFKMWIKFRDLRYKFDIIEHKKEGAQRPFIINFKNSTFIPGSKPWPWG